MILKLDMIQYHRQLPAFNQLLLTLPYPFQQGPSPMLMSLLMTLLVLPNIIQAVTGSTGGFWMQLKISFVPITAWTLQLDMSQSHWKSFSKMIVPGVPSNLLWGAIKLVLGRISDTINMKIPLPDHMVSYLPRILASIPPTQKCTVKRTWP